MAVSGVVRVFLKQAVGAARRRVVIRSDARSGVVDDTADDMDLMFVVPTVQCEEGIHPLLYRHSEPDRFDLVRGQREPFDRES